MSVYEIVGQVEAAGIALRLDGERIRIRYPEPQQREELAGQVAFLRTHRDEVAEFLRVRGEGDEERAPQIRGTDRNGEPRDYYEWRAHLAIDAICSIPAPEGLIAWLRDHSPSLHVRLTRDLLDEISSAWNAKIRFEDFDALCSRLVDTFQRAADLYNNSKQTPNLFEQREITEGECGR